MVTTYNVVIVISPDALSFGPETSSIRTFQGTFSAQDEPPPTTFKIFWSLHQKIEHDRHLNIDLVRTGAHKLIATNITETDIHTGHMHH